MKLKHILLIFAIVIRWTRGEHNEFVNHKQLKDIGKNMDMEANPCGNFYQYACGKWSEEHADYANKFNNTRGMMEFQINAELAGLMETMSLKDKPEFVKKAYDFYTSCNKMDKEWDASFYIDWMKEHENINWALLPHSNETTFDWVHVLGVARRYNMDGQFINIEVVDNVDGGPTKVVIHKRNVFARTPVFTEESLMKLGTKMPENVESFEELWYTIDLFQDLLFSLLIIPDTERKSISVKDLPMPWLQRLLPIVLNQPEVDPNLELYLEDVAYLEKFNQLLQEYDDTFISSYLEIQFLNQFYSTVSESNPIGCMATARTLMPLAFNWLYEENHTELEDQKPQVGIIFDNIVPYLKQSISADQSGLIPKEYLNKLDNLKLKVGNLPLVGTVLTLEQFYASLELTHSNFYINHVNLFAFAFNSSRYYHAHDLSSNFGKFFDASELYSQVPYWVYSTDILMVPTVSLRQPLHHWGYDEIYMYSSLGTHIARAIMKPIGSRYLQQQQRQQLTIVASLRAAYKTYFGKFPDALDEGRTIHDTEISSKQLFFLNAVQFYCEMSKGKSEEAVTNLNTAISYVPEFSDAFECKIYEYIKFFNNF